MAAVQRLNMLINIGHPSSSEVWGKDGGEYMRDFPRTKGSPLISGEGGCQIKNS